ncbi:metal ABC transporter permease [Candidatus Micrarchaeota archaeon]|nr:metal ABC transporter permease [Candidatus Micrarchaeota archaeon]
MVFEVLTYEFMQRAFIGGILVALLCASLGVFLVLKRLSLLGDGLAHAAFGGVAIGLLLGIYPVTSALVVTAASALGVQELIKKLKVYGESATAIVLSVAMGLAVVIIGIGKGFNVDLFSYLFGSILALNNMDLLIIGTVFILSLAFLALFYKKLVFISFNSEIAQTSGINVELIDRLFVIIIAMTVVVAIRAVGILLVSSLFVLPAVTAFQIASSFKKTMIYSVLIALFSVILGVVTSFYLDLPPGGTIVLILFGVFLISIIFKQRKKHRRSL